jgi:hypothetical protein
MKSNYYNANPSMSKRKYTKKKSDFELLPPRNQLMAIMGKFEDPLSEVLSILDPFHDKIVRPQVISNSDIPVDPNYGLFQVIYWIKDGKRTKFHTDIVKAKDGFGARSKVDVEFIELRMLNQMKVVGVECLIVPKKYIWKINEDHPIQDQKGLMKIQADLEKEEIIKKLEVFEVEELTPDLSKFINDE